MTKKKLIPIKISDLYRFYGIIITSQVYTIYVINREIIFLVFATFFLVVTFLINNNKKYQNKINYGDLE